MTPRQVELLRDSWRYVGPFADHAAQLFYARLFELSPEIRDLFKFADMPAQGRKLLTALNLAVINAHDMNSMAPALKAMGRRHASYGVKTSHYDVVGHALIWTLEQDLGAVFVGEVRMAWIEFYSQVANTMMASPANRHCEPPDNALGTPT